jgi:hypothetical protein
LYVPNVSVKVEITSLVGVRLGVKSGVETVNFDVKAKLEEKERKSQMVVLDFKLLLNTKPSLVKFEVEGIATLTGKDSEINKMLETDPETKVPYVFQRVYQHVFTATYLLSTILNVPPPPGDLLFPHRQGVPAEDVSVELGTEAEETTSTEPSAEEGESKK